MMLGSDCIEAALQTVSALHLSSSELQPTNKQIHGQMMNGSAPDLETLAAAGSFPHRLDCSCSHMAELELSLFNPA